MTRAAQELHIAQPALSKTIARLEEDLGVLLFDRQNRQIRLNTFGKAFLKKVETALDVLDEGRREIADLAGMERGIVHLATNTLGRITAALGAFRTEHPEVNFRILQTAPASVEEMAALLEKGEVDLCFTAASLNHPGVQELRCWMPRCFSPYLPDTRWNSAKASAWRKWRTNLLSNIRQATRSAKSTNRSAWKRGFGATSFARWMNRTPWAAWCRPVLVWRSCPLAGKMSSRRIKCCISKARHAGVFSP